MWWTLIFLLAFVVMYKNHMQEWDEQPGVSHPLWTKSKVENLDFHPKEHPQLYDRRTEEYGGTFYQKAEFAPGSIDSTPRKSYQPKFKPRIDWQQIDDIYEFRNK